MFCFLTSGVPTAVGFTGQANLIVDTSVDFFIATRQSRHKQNADKPDVTQMVSFSFSSTTKGAVLLSATFQSNSLRVFSVSNLFDTFSAADIHSVCVFFHSLIMLL